jgi:hypothetical protein
VNTNCACRDLTADEVADRIENGDWFYTPKIKLRGVEYHSTAYTRAPKSNSYTVSFWHAIPADDESDNSSDVEPVQVLHYAKVHYFLYLDYNDTHSLYALVSCYSSVAVEDVPVPALRESRLAYVRGSRKCFIPAASINSRVLFIQNSKLPRMGPENRKTMFVSQDLDHRYEFT